MSYRNQFIHAVQRSAKLGMIQPNTVLPLSNRTIRQNKLQSYLAGCMAFFKLNGIVHSSQLTECCASVHAGLAAFLSVNKLPCHVTIGEFHWNQKPFFDFYRLDELVSEIESPSAHEDLKAHCWLTLPDGSVLDLTINSDLSKITQRPYLPLHANAIYVGPKECDPDHYYVPILVGEEYLRRVKAISK